MLTARGDLVREKKADRFDTDRKLEAVVDAEQNEETGSTTAASEEKGREEVNVVPEKAAL